MANLGKFTKYSINTLLTSAVTTAMSAAISIITARYLGAYGKGQLTLILVIPVMIVTFGRMGINHSINYYASKVSPTKLIINTFFISIVLCLALLLVSIPSIYLIKDIFFKGIEMKEIYFVCFMIVFLILYDNFPAILQGMYEINKRNFVISVQPVLNLIFLLFLVVIFKLKLWGAILSWAFALIISVCISLMIVIRKIDFKKFDIDLAFTKKILSYGLKSHIGNILKYLSYRSDVLLINYFLNPFAVGYYIVAVNIAEILWKFPEAIGSVLLPKIAKMNKSEAKLFTPSVFRIVLLPVMVSCILLLLLGKKIIVIAFGSEFLPSVSALFLLLPGVLALSFWKIIANDLIAQGHAVKYSVTSGIALLTMIFFDILLIPGFGINGAAIASSISYLIAAIYIIYFYIRITGNSIGTLFVLRKIDFAFYARLLSAKKK